MLVQNIYINNNKIFTIIHKEMDDGIDNRKRVNETQIKDNILKIEERKLSDDIEFEVDFVREGFLEVGNKKNPYHSYSVNFKEYINKNKPLCIEDIELMCEIGKFVKENTNYDLLKNPYSIGNIIEFIPNKIEMKICNEKKGIIGIELEGLNKNNMSILKMKYNGIIQETYIEKGIECKVFPKRRWHSCDIEVFEEGIIVYAEYNIAVMNHENLNLVYVGKSIETELKTQSKKIKITETYNREIKLSNENDLENIEMLEYDKKEWYYNKKIKDYTEKKTYFLGKNESKLAFDVFEEIMEQNCDEVWIFDPYAIEYRTTGGVEKIRDILKIIAKKRNIKKYIVYNKKKIAIDEFIDKIMDEELKIISRNLKKLNIEYIAVNENFHDRFIFCKQDKHLTGYIIGTSLNSFGENYSTLLNLRENDCESIFQRLLNEIVNPENIITKNNI